MSSSGKGSSTGTILLIVFIVWGIITVGFVMSSYNKIVTAQEGVESSYSNIETQLQRRADLIPNLVKTVKGYMEHEKDVIDSITESREKLLSADNIQDIAEANEELSEAINNLLVLVENYPDLKASENFIELQDELAGTENRIATSRRDYNEAVRTYNTKIKRFPGMFIAKLFGFEKAEYFKAKEGSAETPDVEF